MQKSMLAVRNTKARRLPNMLMANRVRRYSQHIYFRMRDRLIGGITHVATGDKLVALTFDDGPNPVFTPQILQVLAQYHAKATFFMIGEHVHRHSEIVRAVQAAGHAIGNHTYTHRRLAGCSLAQVRIELIECQRVLRVLLGEAYGRTGKLMRPPYGAYDTTTALFAKSQRYRMVLWSVSGEDWRHDDAGLVAQRIMAQTQPGSIVLLHDGWNTSRHSQFGDDLVADRAQTVLALTQVLPVLAGQGYQFVTMPELLAHEGVRVVRKRY